MSTLLAGAPLSGARSGMSGWLYLPSGRWNLLIFGGLVLAVVALPYYAEESYWIGLGIFATTVALGHGALASRAMPWIPSLAIGIACLQWILAPWMSYHVPPAFSLYTMILPPEEYFSYAVPATIVLATGMYLPMALRPPRAGVRITRDAMPLDLRVTCDGMIVGGILAQVVLPQVVPASLRFLALLLGNLAFVGLFTLILGRARGWQWRALPVFMILVATSASSGMFHDFMLWSSYGVLVVAFALRVSGTRLGLLGLCMLLIAFLLNSIKQDFRWMLQMQGGTITERTALLGGSFLSELGSDMAFGEEAVRFNITRLNQGWIIARVLDRVPKAEPFAEGETVREAIRAAVLPRIIDPTKTIVGGKPYFERFTGVPLGRASMDLSIAGEMYANFGRVGGLLGVLSFGLLFGVVFRLFARWAEDTPYWWAWAPFVLLYGVKAEGGLAEPLNQIAKSFIVMVAVIAVVPAWAYLRRVTLARAARRLVRRRALGTPG